MKHPSVTHYRPDTMDSVACGAKPTSAESITTTAHIPFVDCPLCLAKMNQKASVQ